MILNFSQFCDNWPEDRKDQFSYEGKRALFEYLEEYEDATGESMEFDPIALCCEYSEYDSATEAANQYSEFIDNEKDEEDQDEDEKEKRALTFLENKTQIIKVLDYKDDETGRVIIQDF